MAGDDLEIDFVLRYGKQIIGVEVKSGEGEANLKSITTFKRKFPEAKIILVGVDGINYREFLGLSLEEIVARA